MVALVATEPQVVHALPGRLRVHLDGWDGGGQSVLEHSLQRLEGVSRASVNAFTANVLVRFDPSRLDAADVIREIRARLPEIKSGSEERPARLHAVHDRQGTTGRARISVPGMERDPQLVARVVRHYQEQPGVTRVTASALTGRILVEFSRNHTTIEDLLGQIIHFELPDVTGGDHPAHPLDSGPLMRASVRSVGAGLGLGLLAGRQLTGMSEPASLRATAASSSAVIGILQSVPAIRSGLQRLVGNDVADLLFYVPSILALTLAGSPLGLALTCAESVRLLTEVLARRSAWRRYEERLENVPAAVAGTNIRLESGDKTPLGAAIIEGCGTAVGRHGLPESVCPNCLVSAGSRLYGGPFVLELRGDEAFGETLRTVPARETLCDRYLRFLAPASLVYAVVSGVLFRSFSRGLQSLLLVNARPAIIGREGADLSASARVLRAGVTVVGTRRDRNIQKPDYLFFDGARSLTDGFEVTTAVPVGEGCDAGEVLDIAAAVSAAAGSPWGASLSSSSLSAGDGVFDGKEATAHLADTRYILSSDGGDAIPQSLRLQHQGESLLTLRVERSTGKRVVLGVVALRPRIAAGTSTLIEMCRRYGIEVRLLPVGQEVASRMVARRASVEVLPETDLVAAIQQRQEAGDLVAVVSDSAQSGRAFDAADLAIALTAGRTSHFPARADLLAPDVNAIAEIVESGVRRDRAVRDSVALSIASNLFGAGWGLRSAPGLVRASYAVYVAALAAISDAWTRLRGGERSMSSVARLVDPRPERWGRRNIADVLRSLHTTEHGLTSVEAVQRVQRQRPPSAGNGTLGAVLVQLRSPLNGVLAAGATLSLVLGATADVIMIGATIAANILVGVWQERQTGHAIAALERIGSTSARVLRDGESREVPTAELVVGDVLVLASGQRIAADARLLTTNRLEVDEAALTGESLPVLKMAEGGSESSHIVLAGSDVTVGTGTAVVVAVGNRTRMGATAAALALDETRASPLGVRLNRMLRQVLPLAAVGGLVVIASGLVRRRALLPQLAVGASIAIAAVPEGLPLLAGVGEAAVARRLARRHALVRRLSAVEALGRVDVACTDKTGTLTEGRLALTCVASMEDQSEPAKNMRDPLRQILLTAGRATPHPEAADAASHPTDVAVVRAVEDIGLGRELRASRDAEIPFDPARAFHAACVGGRLHLKGAVEAVAPRCSRIQNGAVVEDLDPSRRAQLQERAEQLAGRGLRVLMVATGDGEGSVDDPQELVALGFIGISDPLRSEVKAAVDRCRQAGVRVVMLTGDHPATARAIAEQAGLLGPAGVVVTGAEIAELQNGELDARLEHATVVARVTPLDKLRIVESLQRKGHTVAMTGDGVNDGPALRLADVGVAMGLTGTEVARQAADVVLADDDFSTLVEALVEGRSFWRNIRRALALLLGGNLGELGLVVGVSALGLASPLLTRQILAVNLVTDVLPSLAVALQPPENRNLAGLAREGTAALDQPLQRDIWRRGLATALPSLAGFLITLRSAGLVEARSVAFGSVVATQLAQTLDMGRAEGTLTRSVFGAVFGSAGVLVAALTVPPLRRFLGLATPAPASWLLIGVASFAAMLLGRGLSQGGKLPAIQLQLPAMRRPDLVGPAS